MDGSSPDRVWFRTVLARATLVGLALGVVALGGSSLVLAETAPGPISAAVLTATVLIALAVGVWAGSPEATREHLALRERWLSAAAVVAVAGSFATFGALYQQVYPGPWWRVAGLLIVVAAPSYALGLLLPVLLTWGERWRERDADQTGAWGALPPILFGLLGGAAIAALATGFLVLPRWSPASLFMLVAVMLLLPIIGADPASAPSREVVVYHSTTPYGTLEVLDVAFPGERQPERRLYLDDEEESGQLVRSGAPTLAYVAAAETWLSHITPSGASYLFLGGGAYTLPRRIAERDPRARVVVVELDPEVTRLAFRFFGLKGQHGITSIHGDARAYLDSPDAARFDRIYVDVYGGREALPHSLVTEEAARTIGQRLSPGGVMAMNLIGNVVEAEKVQLWSVVNTFAGVFPNVALYAHLGQEFPDRQNLLLAASFDRERVFPASAGLFELWNRADWPSIDGATVFHDLATPSPSEGEVTPVQARAR